MKSILVKGAVATALIASVMGAVAHYSAIPEMHVSHSTGQCVRVINHADTDYTCERQPGRYHHVWVK